MVPPALVQILAAVGAISVASRVLSIGRFIHYFFLRRSSFSRYISSDDKSPTWALVTGASDGIGLGFAHELCSRGINVILHGRNKPKLQAVKEKLIAIFPGRSVEIFVADAAEYDGHAAINSLVELVRSLPENGKLRILVNNVGGANNLIGKGLFYQLEDTTLDEVDTLINVNARFPARLTTALLPILGAEETAPALIINIGSIAAIGLMPFT